MTKVVLDTNIVVSANLQTLGLPAVVLRLAANRKIQMYVSPVTSTCLWTNSPTPAHLVRYHHDLPAMNLPAKKHKLYCYVDETGQDTEGRLFVVAAVIVGELRDALLNLLQAIERASGKGRKKWSKATRKQRQAYLEQVLRVEELQSALFYVQFNRTRDYRACVLRSPKR